MDDANNKIVTDGTNFVLPFHFLWGETEREKQRHNFWQGQLHDKGRCQKSENEIVEQTHISIGWSKWILLYIKVRQT